MASYVITAPDGTKYKLTPPEGATDADIQKAIDSIVNRAAPAPSKPNSSDFGAGFGGGVDSIQATGYGLLGLAGDALNRATGVGEGLRDFGFQGYQANMGEM